MPYPKDHRDRTREHIIESARRLFNQNGFENVSIDAIMAGSGLTRGGFYSYFRSKSDLYVEAMRCFFTDPNWKNRWRGLKFNSNSPNMAAQIVRPYLSLSPALRRCGELLPNGCASLRWGTQQPGG